MEVDPVGRGGAGDFAGRRLGPYRQERLCSYMLHRGPAVLLRGRFLPEVRSSQRG
jgi:hypothetical protein